MSRTGTIYSVCLLVAAWLALGAQGVLAQEPYPIALYAETGRLTTTQADNYGRNLRVLLRGTQGDFQLWLPNTTTVDPLLCNETSEIGTVRVDSDAGSSSFLCICLASGWSCLGTAGTSLCDADSDTCVEVERTTDDDTVRVDLAGHLNAFTGVGVAGASTTFTFAAPTTQLQLVPTLQALNMSGQDYFWCLANDSEVDDGSCWSFDPDLPNAWDSITIGLNANAQGTRCIAIGREADCYARTVALGFSANTIGTNAQAVGEGAWAGSGDAAFGSSVIACRDQPASTQTCVGIGSDIDLRGSTSTDGFLLAIGSGFDSNTEDLCIGIGTFDRNNADDCLNDGDIYLGGDQQSTPFSRLVLGWGAQHASPSTFTITPTEGEGMDNAGADLVIQGSAGTGSGAGGDLRVQHCAGGSTGSSVNSCSDVARFGDGVVCNSAGDSEICNYGLRATAPSSCNVGDLYQDSTTGPTMCSCTAADTWTARWGGGSCA